MRFLFSTAANGNQAQTSRRSALHSTRPARARRRGAPLLLRGIPPSPPPLRHLPWCVASMARVDAIAATRECKPRWRERRCTEAANPHAIAASPLDPQSIALSLNNSATAALTSGSLLPRPCSSLRSRTTAACAEDECRPLIFA